MSNEFKQILIDSGLPTEESEIRQEFEQLTKQEGLITNTSRMSPFWRLISAVAIQPVKWLTDHLISEILPNLFVKTAKGKWLQIQAWAVGLDFKEATKAKGYITFIKESADIPVMIKAGTVVQTERINNKIYKMIIDVDTKIPSGVLSARVLATAEEAGGDYNLYGGYYKILPVAIDGIQQVINEENYLYQPGSDRETDDELRERYRVQFSSVGKHHIDSVYRGMIAQINGISVDRIYFEHDAPRGPGTANVYLLLDVGVPAQPFIDRVNNYIMTQGYHGHGDDLLCKKMPETKHDVSVSVYFSETDNLTDIEKQNYLNEVEQIIRCAFRENNNYIVTKTEPYSRFAWSKLGEEIHQKINFVKSLVWQQEDITSQLNIPRLNSLSVSEGK